jgi:hypothetical protein
MWGSLSDRFNPNYINTWSPWLVCCFASWRTIWSANRSYTSLTAKMRSYPTPLFHMTYSTCHVKPSPVLASDEVQYTLLNFYGPLAASGFWQLWTASKGSNSNSAQQNTEHLRCHSRLTVSLTCTCSSHWQNRIPRMLHSFGNYNICTYGMNVRY